MHIYDHVNTIERWKNCPMANYICPVVKYTKLETNTPRGKAFILSLVANGIRKLDEDIINRIYQCGLCRACEAITRDDTSIPDLILAARRDIVDMNICPDYVISLRSEVLSKSKILNKSWLKETIGQIKSSSKKLIFITYDSPNIDQLRSALNYILDIVGIKVMHIDLGKFPAPASLLNELGYYKEANLVLDNLRCLINADKIKKLIFMVPYDLDFLLRMSINDDLASLKLNAQHSFEFLTEIITSDNNISISKGLNKLATYFDFCSPRYSDKFYKVPRKILGLIPNLKVREMIWTRKESGSCGGLALPYTFPDISYGIATKVLNEVYESNADILISPCPHCVDNLISAQGSGDNLRIIDLWELVSSVI